MAPEGAHRIFQTSWLHELQVRYPWFCGYAVAPLTFAAGRAYGDGALTFLTSVKPVLAQDKSLAACRRALLVAALLFNGHFVRRALEVIYVNDYTGTWQRDSRGELLYYALWGLLAGSASGLRPLQTHGVASRRVRVLGAAICVLGQIGNTWCHLELRRLREQRAALGSSTYIIPSRGPFAYGTCRLLITCLSWSHGLDSRCTRGSTSPVCSLSYSAQARWAPLLPTGTPSMCSYSRRAIIPAAIRPCGGRWFPACGSATPLGNVVCADGCAGSPDLALLMTSGRAAVYHTQHSPVVRERLWKALGGLNEALRDPFRYPLPLERANAVARPCAVYDYVRRVGVCGACRGSALGAGQGEPGAAGGTEGGRWTRR